MREYAHEDETLDLEDGFRIGSGRVEGRAVHRLNCDFCYSMIYRIGRQEDWTEARIGVNACI